MSRRAVLGGVIIVAWLVGLALLVRREYFRPTLERLAEAGARISPGAVFYGVMQGNRHIGFASSTVDTGATGITVSDYLAADLPMGGSTHRATTRMDVTLSRAMRMTKFDLNLETESTPIRALGRIDGDSVLTLVLRTGTDKPTIQRIPLSGPILLPTLVPIAIALGERPQLGKQYTIPVFDPVSMSPRNMQMSVRAESLFVVNDSAVVADSSTNPPTWRGILPDTVRAWLVSSSAKTGGGDEPSFSGWIDEQGRIVATTLLGLSLARMPYEVAFYNWRVSAGQMDVTEDRDILETTAIAADKQMTRRVDSLRVLLSSVDLRGYDLVGQRQRLLGDTLLIGPEPAAAMVAPYQLPGNARDPADTRPEAFIQSRDPRITRLARRIAAGSREPRIVAERINTWVHDSLTNRITFGVPSALQVLSSRSGDCNEHTQLFVALARAVGLPARIDAGLAYVDGKFYYHAWPEVLLGDWVPVDPTFGQFPADAAHLRFVIGGLARQTELLRLMGNLRIHVLGSGEGASR